MRPRSSEAVFDTPGSPVPGVLPGFTPGAVEPTRKPDMLSASAWQSAVCEYALLEMTIARLTAMTTHNVRTPRPANKPIIIDSRVTVAVAFPLYPARGACNADAADQAATFRGARRRFRGEADALRAGGATNS
jgi:hypothetical protein